MIRERDDAVCTFIKDVNPPVMPNTFVRQAYWDEVGKQVALLIGGTRAQRLARILERDAVLHALYKKSEQSRVDIIIQLLRSKRLE